MQRQQGTQGQQGKQEHNRDKRDDWDNRDMAKKSIFTVLLRNFMQMVFLSFSNSPGFEEVEHYRVRILRSGIKTCYLC